MIINLQYDIIRKVCFESEDIPGKILRSKNRNSIEEIRIYPDQTPQQRQYYNNLRDELKARQEKEHIQEVAVCQCISVMQHEVLINACEENNHFLWVHIKNMSLDVGLVYRQPTSNVKQFLKTYGEQLACIKATLAESYERIQRSNLASLDNRRTISRCRKT
ncbi:unnamed protein product [Leptosia nina]|uniref:Uncharacterized protein n=1 Tax=Leptosia nina TaxID=320188 RepID=A0AAV1JEZ2_9NEOP